MGDRATLQIYEGNLGIEIYTHWGGQQALISALRDAIDRGRDRLTDPTYFARIVVNSLTRGEENNTTGVGIWLPNTQENEYGHFAYHSDSQTIRLNGQSYTVGEFLKYCEVASIT